MPALHNVFRAIDGIDFYPQALEDFASDPEVARQYDVVVFYNMHKLSPGDPLAWPYKRVFETLGQLGQTRQGILVLHHALLAFPAWPTWSALTGNATELSSYHMSQTIPVHIEDRTHPITAGLDDWTMVDETYVMPDAAPDRGNHILLTTTHQPSTRTLAWTRTFGQSRVFCWQSGHDHRTFDHPAYRQVMANALRWLAEE